MQQINPCQIEGGLEVITRAEARERGLVRYFSGKPCPRGHVAERYTGKATCVVCSGIAYLAQPPERLRERARKSYRARMAEPEKKAALRARQREYQRSRRSRDREYRQRTDEHVLRSRYGFPSPEAYREFVALHPTCGICGVATGRLVIDHSHDCCGPSHGCMNCVRGRLCSACNTALGLFADSPDRLLKAIDYLQHTGLRSKR